MIKNGDLVKLKGKGGLMGIVIEIFEKKIWRSKMGHTVNWNEVDPEPHAAVLSRGSTFNIPCVDLEIVDGSR